MPFPLHKAPEGLLQLMRLRTLGANPNQFDEVAGAFIEVANFYGSDLLVSSTVTDAAGAISQTSTGTAQFPGRLFAMSGQITVGAAAGTNLRLILRFAPNVAFPPVTVADRVVTPVANASFHISVLFPSPIVFKAGAQFVLSTSGDAAGADHVLTRRDLLENYAPA